MMDSAETSFANWLRERLSETSLAEEIPSEALRTMCQAVAAAGLKGNLFETRHLIEWIVSEYGLERDQMVDLIAGLSSPAQSLGVTMVFSVDEVFSEGAIAKEKVEESVSEVEAGTPTVPAAPAAPTTPIAPAAPPPASPRPVVGASPPARAPASAPTPALDTLRAGWKKPLSLVALDDKYWTKIFTEYAIEGKEPADKVLDMILSSFALKGEHFEYLARRPSEEEGADAAEVYDNIILAYGKALVRGYIYFLSLSQAEPNFPEMEKSLTNLVEESAKLNAQFMGQIAKARRLKLPSLNFLEAAIGKFQEQQTKVNEEYKLIEEKKVGAKKPEPASPAKAKSATVTASLPTIDEKELGPARLFIRRNEKAIIAISAVLILICLGYWTIRFTRAEKKSVLAPVTVDVSRAGIKVLSTSTDGTGLLAVVDIAEWRKLDQEQKTAVVRSIYDAASQSRLQQVQLRSADGEPLAQGWSRDRIAIIN